MPKLLVAEDDPVLCEMIADVLRQQKYCVEVSRDGTEALDLLAVSDYDVLILDWAMPGATGIDILKNYRGRGGTAAVLLLTAKGSIFDKDVGFSAGSDDYLTKPFHPKELILRVHALLRRAAAGSGDSLTAGTLCLNPVTHQVSCNGSPLSLQPAEFRLLEFFLRKPGQIFSTDALLSRVWSSDSCATADSVRMCVARLRNHLKNLPGCPIIETIKGVGYKLRCDQSTDSHSLNRS